MTDKDQNDPVTQFLSEYIDALEAGLPVPEWEGLSDLERREAEELLTEMALDFSADIQVNIPPVEESAFAVDHGIVRHTPPVAIQGDALRRARTAAGLSPEQLAAHLADFGITADATRVMELEKAESTLVAARDARRYAAVIGVPLEQIEASAEPWPSAERDQLDVSAGYTALSRWANISYFA